MRTPLRSLSVVAALLLGGTALPALAEPKDFVPPSEMSEAELARLKEASRSNLGKYGKAVSDKPEPIPWMAIFLGVITVLGVAPFAYRAYANTAKELRESGPGAAPSPPGRQDDL